MLLKKLIKPSVLEATIIAIKSPSSGFSTIEVIKSWISKDEVGCCVPLSLLLQKKIKAANKTIKNVELFIMIHIR